MSKGGAGFVNSHEKRKQYWAEYTWADHRQFTTTCCKNSFKSVAVVLHGQYVERYTTAYDDLLEIRKISDHPGSYGEEIEKLERTEQEVRELILDYWDMEASLHAWQAENIFETAGFRPFPDDVASEVRGVVDRVTQSTSGNRKREWVRWGLEFEKACCMPDGMDRRIKQWGMLRATPGIIDVPGLWQNWLSEFRFKTRLKMKLARTRDLFKTAVESLATDVLALILDNKWKTAECGCIRLFLGRTIFDLSDVEFRHRLRNNVAPPAFSDSNYAAMRDLVKRVRELPLYMEVSILVSLLEDFIEGCLDEARWDRICEGYVWNWIIFILELKPQVYVMAFSSMQDLDLPVLLHLSAGFGMFQNSLLKEFVDTYMPQPGGLCSTQNTAADGMANLNLQGAKKVNKKKRKSAKSTAKETVLHSPTESEFTGPGLPKGRNINQELTRSSGDQKKFNAAECSKPELEETVNDQKSAELEGRASYIITTSAENLPRIWLDIQMPAGVDTEDPQGESSSNGEERSLYGCPAGCGEQLRIPGDKTLQFQLTEEIEQCDTMGILRSADAVPIEISPMGNIAEPRSHESCSIPQISGRSLKVSGTVEAHVVGTNLDATPENQSVQESRVDVVEGKHTSKNPSIPSAVHCGSPKPVTSVGESILAEEADIREHTFRPGVTSLGSPSPTEDLSSVWRFTKLPGLLVELETRISVKPSIPYQPTTNDKHETNGGDLDQETPPAREASWMSSKGKSKAKRFGEIVGGPLGGAVVGSSAERSRDHGVTDDMGAFKVDGKIKGAEQAMVMANTMDDQIRDEESVRDFKPRITPASDGADENFNGQGEKGRSSVPGGQGGSTGRSDIARLGASLGEGRSHNIFSPLFEDSKDEPIVRDDDFTMFNQNDPTRSTEAGTGSWMTALRGRRGKKQKNVVAAPERGLVAHHGKQRTETRYKSDTMTPSAFRPPRLGDIGWYGNIGNSHDHTPKANEGHESLPPNLKPKIAHGTTFRPPTLGVAGQIISQNTIRSQEHVVGQARQSPGPRGHRSQRKQKAKRTATSKRETRTSPESIVREDNLIDTETINHGGGVERTREPSESASWPPGYTSSLSRREDRNQPTPEDPTSWSCSKVSKGEQFLKDEGVQDRVQDVEHTVTTCSIVPIRTRSPGQDSKVGDSTQSGIVAPMVSAKDNPGCDGIDKSSTSVMRAQGGDETLAEVIYQKKPEWPKISAAMTLIERPANGQADKDTHTLMTWRVGRETRSIFHSSPDRTIAKDGPKNGTPYQSDTGTRTYIQNMEKYTISLQLYQKLASEDIAALSQENDLLRDLTRRLIDGSAKERYASMVAGHKAIEFVKLKSCPMLDRESRYDKRRGQHEISELLAVDGPAQEESEILNRNAGSPSPDERGKQNVPGLWETCLTQPQLSQSWHKTPNKSELHITSASLGKSQDQDIMAQTGKVSDTGYGPASAPKSRELEENNPDGRVSSSVAVPRKTASPAFLGPHPPLGDPHLPWSSPRNILKQKPILREGPHGQPIYTGGHFRGPIEVPGLRFDESSEGVTFRGPVFQSIRHAKTTHLNVA